MPTHSVGRLRTATRLVVLSALLLAGCSGGGGGEQGGGSQDEESAQEPISGSFVGTTSDPETLVAVVADKAEGGADSREVRAYLCNSEDVGEWFRGSVTGNTVDLASDGGAQLTGELTSDAATGSVTLPVGEVVSFGASPATGIGGLYSLSISPDGRVSGTSERGGQLEGRADDRPREDGAYPITATITSPDGQQQEFEAFSLDPPAEFERKSSYPPRFVVLPDGTIKGGGRPTRVIPDVD